MTDKTTTPKGLTTSEARELQEKFGKNELILISDKKSCKKVRNMV